MDIPTARDLLRTHGQLLDDGMTSRGIAAAVASGSLHKLSRGLYIPTAGWSAEYTEGREVIRATAVHDRMRTDAGAFVLTSAAALHALPLVRVSPQRAHVALSSADGRAGSADRWVARHEMTIPPDDIVEVDGIRMTSLARTVADMLRASSRETGMAIACAALRQIAWDARTQTYDVAAAEAFRAEVAARLPAGRPHVVKAREVLALADGRVVRPGEAISLMYLRDLGFAMPRLQVPVRGPNGSICLIDFGIDDADAWGEFDGRVKYLDPAMRGATETTADVLLHEKSREDWIRGTTQRKYGLWGWEHIPNAPTLGMRLAAFHIRPPQ